MYIQRSVSRFQVELSGLTEVARNNSLLELECMVTNRGNRDPVLSKTSKTSDGQNR